MSESIYDAVVEAGAKVITEPGLDCGACYVKDESECRPAQVTLHFNKYMLVYPCGRVEVCEDDDNFCLAAGQIAPADTFNEM